MSLRLAKRHVALEGGGQGDMHLFAFIALVTRPLLDAGAQHDKELDLSSSVSARQLSQFHMQGNYTSLHVRHDAIAS